MAGCGQVFDYTAQANRIDGVVDFDYKMMERTFIQLNGYPPGLIEYQIYCPECEKERADEK